jgi:hypothetical protein
LLPNPHKRNEAYQTSLTKGTQSPTDFWLSPTKSLQQNLQAQMSKKKKKKNPQLLFSPESSEEILILKPPLTQHP